MFFIDNGSLWLYRSGHQWNSGYIRNLAFWQHASSPPAALSDLYPLMSSPGTTYTGQLSTGGVCIS
jgi:hypothetical protein